MEVTEFVLSLGSNLGDKKKYLSDAISLLSVQFGKPLTVSSFYKSEPWGFESENEFVNCCVKFKTNLSCHQVLEITQKVESKLGRSEKTSGTYSSREIDIDIVFFGRELLDLIELTVPHKHFQDRKFVLIPLKEIEEMWVDPRSGLTIDQLILSCSDESKLLTV